jgi:hypothetical protein
MENEMDKSPRPKAKPMKSPRPKPRPADLMENYNLMRAMKGTDAKAVKEDLKAAKKMAMGGKLKMVEKGGKKVPAFAADGVGKMAMGGKCRGMGSASKGGSYSKNG